MQRRTGRQRRHLPTAENAAKRHRWRVPASRCMRRVPCAMNALRPASSSRAASEAVTAPSGQRRRRARFGRPAALNGGRRTQGVVGPCRVSEAARTRQLPGRSLPVDELGSQRCARRPGFAGTRERAPAPATIASRAHAAGADVGCACCALELDAARTREPPQIEVDRVTVNVALSSAVVLCACTRSHACRARRAAEEKEAARACALSGRQARARSHLLQALLQPPRRREDAAGRR